MLGKKLTQILRALDRKTFRGLGQAVASPVFTTDAGMEKMYRFLEPHYPQFGEDQLDRKALYAALYPNKQYKDGTLRVKIRQFTRLVEDYMVWQYLQGEERLRQRLLLRSMSYEDLYPLFARETKKALQAQEQEEGPRDLDYYQHRSALLYRLYFHPRTDKYQEQEDWLAKLADSVDGYFMLTKFRLAIATKNLDAILDQWHPIRFWESLREEHESGLLAGHTLTELYFTLFALLDSEEDADFYRFKGQFRAHQREVPLEDLPSLYYTALNFLTRKINSGRAEFYRELLEWYQLGLTDDLLLREGQISEVTFNNIALLGYRSRAFDWTDQFVDKYAAHLDPKVVEDAVTCSRGLGFFYQGQYANAIAALYNHQFSRAYQLRVRLTIIRAMYEQFRLGEPEYDRLASTINSFEVYMKRDRTFADRILEPYRNHLYLLKGLMQMDLNKASAETRIAWLEDALQQRPNVIAKEWIKAKAER